MLSLVIQAGGLSRRMGRDKGLVLLNGTPLVEHVINRLEGLANEIIITTNKPKSYQYLNHALASDKNPGAGALTGLHTALKAAHGKHVFVIACDMPLVNRKLVEYIISCSEMADVVIPYFADRYQPLHALYHRENCLPPISQSLAEKQKRMIAFHSLVSIHKISTSQIKSFDPEGQSFENVNTPEELARLEENISQVVY